MPGRRWSSRAGRVAAIVPPDEAPEPRVERVLLRGGVIAPGFVDLQVNGGGGVMLGDRPGVAEIATICAAHARLGTLGLLPTLITDTPGGDAGGDRGGGGGGGAGAGVPRAPPRGAAPRPAAQGRARSGA